MKRSLLPLLFATAALALAGAATAQDRDHRGDGGGMRHERASDSNNRSSAPSRSRGHDDARSRSDDTRGRDPFRSGDDRQPGSRSDRGVGTSSERTGRTNPFERNGGGSRDPLRDRPEATARERIVVGAPARDYARNPSHWDGRGRFDPVHFAAPPRHDSLSIAIGATSVRRGTEVAIGAQIGGLRVGYVSYSGGGYRRSAYGGFGYPYYAYDPYAPDLRVVASPWYRYSYLPPYLDDRRVIVVDDYPSSWDWSGWRTYDRDRRDDAVSDALDDLRDAFEENSDRIAERLVPVSGEVAIFNDGRYDYSMNADDFDKMFRDGIDGSRTDRYEILETRTHGDEVRVRARHTFTDSWGEPQTAIHTITLRRDRGGDYVIREFGTE